MNSQSSGYAPYFQHHAAATKIQEYSRLPFSKWWDQSLFHPTAKMNLSRKNIVFHVRAKDGGAHVDDHLTDFDYRLLKTVGDPRVHIGGSNQTPQPPGNVIWPIIRQIAWEIDYSLVDAGL
ncbi:MAG: hypothetical protein JF604_04270 [Bradyrhizobium sp.]|nr:hypothetical protein [Bradyrhizobium sp.]